MNKLGWLPEDVLPGSKFSIPAVGSEAATTFEVVSYVRLLPYKEVEGYKVSEYGYPPPSSITCVALKSLPYDPDTFEDPAAVQFIGRHGATVYLRFN